ncbi:NusA-like transcription termination signal-binding factor [Candidatus Bathyarchaeota archaeon]|jgi:transcription termination/antitermination protein NusA|nr:NusA-like transcription termination signal-binding factor [Candidatus Bathyarchaeota archaeon]MBT4321116.1 NusA-like transcription termination signal-binding factor [Candidatus Bathyarchaeota archaeon]MBT4424587.1 NusA-like transcription termination signal-binding factor [Candidatus Bathyarchaeota archaeon]MBT5642729.1 NusA-like transcription termination signal-binding factor [Candidatus Bathyarchaeota archaeon]MBT6604297.1 NusA-like transcription termination signal-binding factor [Candidatu
MLNGIKITQDEMKFIQLLQNMTGATIVDCIIDEETIIFTVKKGEVGLAVGKGGEKIRRFRTMTNKQVEIYEYMNEAEKFIKNALKPAKIKDIRLVDRMEGKKIAMVTVEPKDKGIAIGKNGDNIKKIRFLSKRYFQLDTVVIN